MVNNLKCKTVAGMDIERTAFTELQRVITKRNSPHIYFIG